MVEIVSANQFSKKLSAAIEVDDLELLPKINWDEGFYNQWRIGEAFAQESLKQFIKDKVEAYKENRDIPSTIGTSRLSASLHFGEISPRQVVDSVRSIKGLGLNPGSDCYLSEVGWREFSIHLLYHFPDLTQKPLRPEFEKFPWIDDRKKLIAWQKE